VTKWTNVLSGKVQKALDATWKWSRDNFVDYHITGKKAPEYYVFIKKGCTTDQELKTPLLLGDTPLKRSYELVQLGVFVCFYKCQDEASQHGYFLDWRSTKTQFNRMAWRLQQIRDYWNPQMRWRTCRVYILGKLMYASCLYYLRAKEECLDKVRFFYVMCLAAVMGLEASEVVTLRNCKLQKVKADNKSFLRACKFLNMPTLKDLAIDTSKYLLKQWAIFRPAQFILGEDGAIVDAAPGEDKLLKELIALSKEEKNDWYPAFNEAKGKDRREENFDDDDLPLWRNYWRNLRETVKDYNVSFNKVANGTFMRMCRDHFNALEPEVRVKKTLDLAVSLPVRRNFSEVSTRRDFTDDPDTAEPKSKKRRHDDTNAKTQTDSTKRKRDDEEQSQSTNAETARPVKRPRRKKFLERLNCDVPPPKVRGRKNKPCRICGYAIGKQSAKDRKAGAVHSVDFVCCKRTAHMECWTAAAVVSQEVNCKSLRWALAKDRATPIRAVDKEKQPDNETFSNARCEYCGELIDLRTGKNKHLELDCKVLRMCGTRMTMVIL